MAHPERGAPLFQATRSPELSILEDPVIIKPVPVGPFSSIPCGVRHDVPRGSEADDVRCGDRVGRVGEPRCLIVRRNGRITGDGIRNELDGVSGGERVTIGLSLDRIRSDCSEKPSNQCQEHVSMRVRRHTGSLACGGQWETPKETDY